MRLLGTSAVTLAYKKHGTGSPACTNAACTPPENAYASQKGVARHALRHAASVVVVK